MNTLDKLLTNTTNRFSNVNPIISTQFQSNFTPIQSSQNQQHSFQSVNISLLQHFEDHQIHETYEQLQQRCNELAKVLQQAKHEKQIMTILFEKIFLVEQGEHQQMKRRFRRKKTQIDGKYACKRCSKIYSSSTSLARHTKLKHSSCMFEPPQVKYQIPPEPNSINQQSEVEELNGTESNECQVKQEKLSDESHFNEFDSCQESESVNSEKHEAEPLSRELT